MAINFGLFNDIGNNILAFRQQAEPLPPEFGGQLAQPGFFARVLGGENPFSARQQKGRVDIGPAAIAPAAGGPSAMKPFQDAIASIESDGSGGYAAIGPKTSSGDRGHGRYQVMGANIPQWTQEVLGRPLTPAQFVASSRAQDAVFNAKFGSYLQKTGSPQDAASMWFTGRPLAKGGASARDVNGMSGSGYASRFERALDFGSGGGPSAGPTPDGPVRLAGPVPTQDTVPLSNMGQGQGGAAPGGIPSVASVSSTTPAGQAIPDPSFETLYRMMQNPYHEGIAKVFLERKLRGGQLQIKDIPVNDPKTGKFAGTQPWLISSDGRQAFPVPGAGINTSVAKGKNEVPALIQEYEYSQQHPAFSEFRKGGAKEGYEGEVAARRRVIEAQGGDPKDLRTQQFINTGRYPREDTSPLTATDKKAILEADDIVLSGENAITALEQAKRISPTAMGFPGAGTLAKMGAVTGSQTAQATVDLDNVVLGQAVESLRSIFGGMPTEGERKILIELQGSSGLPDAVRQKIYDRAQKLAERRTELNRRRAKELREGEFYKPREGGREEVPAATAQSVSKREPPKVGQVWGGYRFKGGDPADKNSWEKP